VKIVTVIAAALLSVPCWATSYYISPSGLDTNSGTSSGSPWLTPNHTGLNCGDTITAATGAYSAANFQSGDWGTVTCSGNNNVVWLQCTTFAACTITVSSGTLSAMWLDKSYWGVQGFVLSVGSSSTYGACIKAVPPSGASATIHHIILANNVANGCQGNGLTTASTGNYGVDYIAIIGNIAYNAAQSSTECYSGISIYEPTNADTVAGTHIYIAGNFSWANFDNTACLSGASTDGEGIILDTLDWLGGGPGPYSGQIVLEDNILVGNGGRGFEGVDNYQGSGTHATIYFEYNTLWDNGRDTVDTSTQSEVRIHSLTNTTVSYNLAVNNGTTSGQGSTQWAYYCTGSNASGSNTVTDTWGYNSAGNTFGISGCSGFSYGPGNTSTNPGYTSPAVPGAPSCGSYSSVPACMATMIANFVPTTSGASGYGYQTPGPKAYDPLFPQWLCNVTLPSGLVTVGCAAAPTARHSSAYIM
jgi:hypothetical protein